MAYGGVNGTIVVFVEGSNPGGYKFHGEDN